MGSVRKFVTSYAGRRLILGAFIEWLRDACLKADSLLTAKRLRIYPILVIVMSVGTFAVSIGKAAITGGLPFDSFGSPVAVDLTAHVTAGWIALHGDLSRLYDLNYQWQVQQGLLGSGHEGFLDAYLSPPFVAFAYAPLAGLPYLTAAVLWTVFTIILLALSFHLIWPLVPNLHRYGYRRVLIVTLSCWPVFELLGDGQDSAISLLLLVAGLRLLLARRDLVAGGLLGLGLFKPQLFLMIPVLLLLQRRWRALGGWVTVALVLAGVSMAIMGVEGARSYVDVFTSDSYGTWIADRLGWKMQSLAALARTLFVGSSAFLVAPIMAVGGAIALVLLIKASSRQVLDDRATTLLYAFSILLIPMFNPHFFIYDVVVLLPGALILLNERPASPAVRVSIATAYVLTFTAPIRYILFGHAPGPIPFLSAPWTVVPFVVLAFLARAAQTERHLETRGPATLP